MKIELRAVVKEFKSLRALDDVSLTIEPGQIIALLGPNGAGKTTLLRCLAGTVAADSGEVLYDGEKFLRHRMDLRRRFMFLPDFPAVFEEWSPLQHIGMVLRLYGLDQAGVEDRVVQALEEFDLLPLARAPFYTLSRGQRYKAVLAAMVAVNPELWLFDEPFASGMDPHGLNGLKGLAREQAAKHGRTIIYSTQILDAAERFCDRLCVIHRGKVRAFATYAELRSQSQAGDATLDELFKQLREEDAS